MFQRFMPREDRFFLYFDKRNIDNIEHRAGKITAATMDLPHHTLITPIDRAGVSAAMYGLGHGGNDAQKTAGIIWMLLFAAGLSAVNDPVPGWVVLSCYITIALGSAFGGWRIVKTMGQKITKLKPVGGAMTLSMATAFGIPVPTTHTITGAIVGVGAVKSATAGRWGVAGNISCAWIITIPAAAFISAVAFELARLST